MEQSHPSWWLRIHDYCYREVGEEAECRGQADIEHPAPRQKAPKSGEGQVADPLPGCPKAARLLPILTQGC